MARHHFVERKTRYKMAIPKFATAINPARKKVNKPPPVTSLYTNIIPGTFPVTRILCCHTILNYVNYSKCKTLLLVFAIVILLN